MTTKLQSESRRVLRWVFRQDDRAITCEIDANGPTFDVCVVPHWNVSASLVERYGAVHSAFQRHAEVARELRDAGWIRAESRPTSPLRTAA